VGQTLSVRSDGTASFRGEAVNWKLSKGGVALVETARMRSRARC